MDYLNSILGRKRADLKKLLPLEGKLRASAIQRNDYAGFRTAVDLGETRLSVVPEISRVHPALRLQEGVQDIRHMYGMFLQGGAQGISIAVEPEVYGGSWDMVSTVSRISSIPVMARDVFIHPAMICRPSSRERMPSTWWRPPAGKGFVGAVPHGFRAGTGRNDGGPYPEGA